MESLLKTLTPEQVSLLSQHFKKTPNTPVKRVSRKLILKKKTDDSGNESTTESENTDGENTDSEGIPLSSWPMSNPRSKKRGRPTKSRSPEELEAIAAVNRLKEVRRQEKSRERKQIELDRALKKKTRQEALAAKAHATTLKKAALLSK